MNGSTLKEAQKHDGKRYQSPITNMKFARHSLQFLGSSYLLFALVAGQGTLHLHAEPPSNGLAPEVPGLNLSDKLYQLEAKLPDLEKPYISSTPANKNDGLTVGKLGVDGGDRAAIEAYANELAAATKDDKAGNVDSMLISYRGKLIFESYYRRGRGNFPHYQDRKSTRLNSSHVALSRMPSSA